MQIKTYVGAIRKAADYLRSRAAGLKPRVGLILGSGLAKAVPALRDVETVPYSQIPGFPRNTVPGHEGKMILGRWQNRAVMVMQGRFHYYEGHSMESIALPVRAMEYLGVKTLVVTAAVGSMRAQIKPGHFTIISDHINFMGRNPLRAFHEEEFGTMFPDLVDAYDPKLRRLALALCRRRRIPAREGVYVGCGGPSYETPAEIRAFRAWGGDVVGMSVIPEIIPARQMGMKCLAVTWAANMASGLVQGEICHADVLALGDKVSGHLRLFLEDLLSHI